MCWRSPEFLAQRGVELFEIDRGGDVTFHGPGQLVAYPIFDLRSFEPKVGAVEYVRRLEEVLIRTCGDFGIGTQRIKGLTGVWTYALPNKPEAKIAAIGVHISRAVTTHGFALNVSTDLDFFSLIVPCGLTGKPVTSMERELQKPCVGRSRDCGFAQLRPRLQLADAVAGIARRSARRRQRARADEPANQDTPARPPKGAARTARRRQRAGVTAEPAEFAMVNLICHDEVTDLATAFRYKHLFPGGLDVSSASHSPRIRHSRLLRSKTLPQMGGAHRPRFIQADPSVAGRLRASFRHHRKARPAPSAGHRPARRAFRRDERRRSRSTPSSSPSTTSARFSKRSRSPEPLAYSLSTQLTLLQETVKEMARNGCKKVVIVNGHGGNNSLLPLFAQAQLATPRDYVVYVFGFRNENVPGRPALKTPNRHARRRSGNIRTCWSRGPTWCTWTAPTASRRRSESSEVAGQRLHRHLVVRRVSRPLLRAMLGCEQATRRVRPEDVVQPDRRSHQRRQGRPAGLKLQNEFFEEDHAPARHEAVVDSS